MSHHRLFVALRPPAAVRAGLTAMMGGIAGARWQSDEQLHCTLRFLGELDHHAAEDVAAALGGLRHAAIEARLEGVGQFGRGGRIASLWVGVTPRDAVEALHGKVDRLLARAGIAPDARAYLPHITIARFSRTAAPPAGIETTVMRPDPAGFRFTEARLYESLLGPEGPTYATVARYPLT